MKKLLFVLCISAFFVACNGGASTTETPAADTTSTMSTTPAEAPAAADTMSKMSADTSKMAADTTKK